MNPVIMSYIGDQIQNLPPEAFDILSLVLLAVLVITVIIGAMGIISSLLEITMYAVFVTVGVAGLFFLTDYVDINGAVDIVAKALEFVIGLF